LKKKCGSSSRAIYRPKRTVWERDKAAKHFLDLGETYKAEIIRDLPKDEEVRVYYHGNWHDLCRGPHLMSTGKIGLGFKLTKIAGAYWRGDAKNAQLQRIYGTAWRDEKELNAYLVRVEESEKRDHRKLGREMDLFHVQGRGGRPSLLASQGMDVVAHR